MVKKLADRFAQDGMDPVPGNFRERDQDKTSVGHFRVGHLKIIFMQNAVIVKQQVEID